MRCAGCQRELEVGDQFIEGSASDFLEREVDPAIGNLMADLFGGKIVYCEACTEPGGNFMFSTYYGDEDA
jgi:hypothetical protein